MRFPSRLILLAAMLLTSACSTVIEGTTQKISVDSYPSGARCVVKDNDLILARVQTPGIAVIDKNKNDIYVECAKEGYITAGKRNNSDMAITSLGNMALGQWSFIGNAVDTASGANNKYDPRVFVTLTELPPIARMQPEDKPQVATGGLAAGAQPAPQNLAGLPPEQLGRQLASMFGGGNVVVTHQPMDQVLNHLMQSKPAASLGDQARLDL